MTIITELANGNTEIFKSDNYTISKIKDFHPLILSVSIYDNGKKIVSKKRVFKWFYKKFTFKSERVQNQLRKIMEADKENKNNV